MIESPDRAPIPREFLDRPVLEVAPQLLGCTLIRRTDEGLIELRITEAEAYAGEIDPGSHAYRGRTARNSVMFGPPGHAYVYFTYGMWHCLNVVCGPEGHASGVLLRAGEITEGKELARKRRPSAQYDKELAKGPARLATALGVDGVLNGTDLCAGEDAPLTLCANPPLAPELVRNGPRTGVGGGGAHQPWRFWIDGDPTVSPYRPHAPRRRST
jgi:DNA-3-methyladenine glycosylase